MIPVKKGSLRLNYSHCIHDWPVMWGIRKSYFHWPLKTHVIVFSDSVNAHEVISRVNRSVYKSQLPANFTS